MPNIPHPVPVTHEFGAFLNIPDLGLYQAIISYFTNEVQDKYNHHLTLDGKLFKFWSKPGGLIHPQTGKNMFEYILHYDSEDKASKCHITIKGFIQGAKTVTGKSFNAPFRGTQFQVQSSYFTQSDILKLYWDFLKIIDARRFENSIDNNKSVIYQCARHVRYHEKHEKDVVQLLQAIKNESTTRGDHDCIDRFRYGAYDMYKLSHPSWDACNIQPDYIQDIKTYRILNFHERLSSDPLRHPKLEVFLNSREQAQIKTVPWSDYDKLIYDQDRLISRFFNILNIYIDYVGDSYFDPSHKYTPRWSLPSWEFRQLKESPSIDLPDNNSALRFLSAVAFTPSGTALIQDIVKETGIPLSSAYRYLTMYRNARILDLSNSLVFFRQTSAWMAIKSSLANLSNYLNFGYSYLYGTICKTSDIIRPYSERHKNYTPITSIDDSSLIVETEEDFKRIKKELDKYNISRRILISRLPKFSYSKEDKRNQNPFISSGRTFYGSLV